MPTVLVTGANRGLGLEFARQYGADGWRVLAACRTPAEATALGQLDGAIEIHPLDVGDHDSITALARGLSGQAIDVLINNAGIHGPRPVPLDNVDYQAWAEVMAINVMSPVKVAECFADHVERGDQKRMVAISSLMGSIAANQSGADYIYKSSKAALNMAMKSLSVDLKPRGITVIMIHPGWVQTDMGGANAPIGPEESISGMRKVIDGTNLGDAGGFFNFDGGRLSW